MELPGTLTSDFMALVGDGVTAEPQAEPQAEPAPEAEPEVDLPEPEFFDFFRDEEDEAVKKREEAKKEMEACELEREALGRSYLEVNHRECYLRELRAQIEYKIHKAEAALKIIAEKSAEVFGNRSS